jgi:GTP cyclohydrolase I
LFRNYKSLWALEDVVCALDAKHLCVNLEEELVILRVVSNSEFGGKFKDNFNTKRVFDYIKFFRNKVLNNPYTTSAPWKALYGFF